MPLPGQTFTIQDPGANVVEPVDNVPVFLGLSSLGTNNVLTSHNSIVELVATKGHGPSVEAATYTLQNAGGPVRHMKMATSVASSNTAVTQTGTGPAVTVAGTGTDDWRGYVVIPSGGGGALGVGKFQYSLDGGTTLSEVQTIPGGGTYLIPNSGITVTFAAGTYVAGTTYTWTSTAPMWNSTDLGNAITALQADLTTSWRYLVFCGRHATGAAAATILAGLHAHMESFATTQFRFRRAMMDAGNEASAAIITAYASTTGNRVLPAYRSVTRASAKTFAGHGSYKSGLVDCAAMQAARVAVSTDLGRVATGPLPGVTAIEHNEFLTPGLDDAKITTARTMPGQTGFFLTNGRLKAASNSDFQYWQFGILMDIACETVFEVQSTFVNAGYRRLSNGAIDPREAARLEGRVLAALRARLTQPKNDEGVIGHVSDLQYSIDLNNTTPNTIVSEVSILPLNYAKYINTTLGFVSSLPAAA